MRLVLPSNSSMSYFPENTLSQFTVRLDKEIDLKNHKYEVGLAEILFNNSWYNIRSCWIEVLYGEKQSTGQLKLPDGFYGDLGLVVHEINKLIKRSPCPDNAAKLIFRSESNRVDIIMKKNFSLKMSSTLSSILGYQEQYISPPSDTPSSYTDVLVKADRMADINNGFHNIYIYCDICEQAPIGDTYASLLGIIPVKHEPHFTSQIIRYESPLFVPVAKTYFQTLTVYLMTDSGVPVQFEAGKTVLTLQLRKASY